MSRQTVLLVFVATACFLSGPAAAGTLETTNGKRFSGAVLRIDQDSVTFLWQKQKDQPDLIRSKNADELFRAQGQKSVAWRIPVEQVATIDGIPILSYKALYSYNGFHRAFDELGAFFMLATGQGGFLHQIKALLIFLGLLLVITPLAMMLVAVPSGSGRLGFMGAIGFVILLSLLGMGCAMISKVALGLGPFMATPAAQVALTVLFVVLLGFVISSSSRFTFWQGLAFAATWGICLVAIGRISARLTGIPSD